MKTKWYNPISWLKAEKTHNLKLDSDSKKIIINQINVRPIARQNADIGKWRAAIKVAEGKSQTRLALYNLYQESLLDAHLKAIIEKRIEAITNTDLHFSLPDGEVVSEITNLTKQPYFQTLLKEIMNTVFWGFTLMQLDFPMPNTEAGDGQVILVPRAHVKPRLGLIVANPNEITGINYTDSEWSDIIITVGETEDLGLLLQACKYEIIKRGNISDWAEFAETFGVDPIIAKYNNDQTREELDAAIDSRGSGGSLTVPADTEIDTLSNVSKTGSSQLFSKLREAMNDEMSVLILGQTMTTSDSSNSGFAQGYIHSQVEAAKYRADRRFIERVLNSQLTPYLSRLGWKTADGEWKFVNEDHIPLEKRITIDQSLSNIIPMDNEYFYKKYGVPKPEGEVLKPKDKKEEKQRDFFD